MKTKTQSGEMKASAGEGSCMSQSVRSMNALLTKSTVKPTLELLKLIKKIDFLCPISVLIK